MPHEPEIVIVDYGMGNLFNLQKVIAHLGARSVITSDPACVRSAQKLILPGVGAFADGIARLHETGMAGAIKDFIKTGNLFLGICLGMQLLMDESQEGGLHQGLGIVQGRVLRFQEPLAGEKNFKIPHIGWNTLNSPKKESRLWQNTLLADVTAQDFVYFVHSYTVCPDDPKVVLAQTQYGRQDFCSVLNQSNIYACQFHPEVSGPVGLKILKNFLSER